MCASERALKNVHIFLSLYPVYTMHNIFFFKHDRNLWGPLFVGAPGQLPTLPSPKSGPGEVNRFEQYL